MLRLIKRWWWGLLLLGGVLSSGAFSLLGPFNEDYQIPALTYMVGGDIGAPKNLGEEYRWNLPIVNYAFDQTFLDYFGSNGVAAVEQAIAILNGLTNLTSYSRELSEFPLESRRVNFRAQALSLFDLKSAALNLLVEQLGLAEPDRWTWALRARFLPSGASCPNYIYFVIKRNFDPVTWEPSSYVNGTLYSYIIVELCPTPDQADAVEFTVDPLADSFTAVASLGNFLDNNGFISYGKFTTGLTKDDAGGLRYLMRTNNFNVEDVPPASELIAGGFTNTAAPQLITTSNLAVFASQALTNDAAALTAIYTNLVITSTTIFFTNVVETNVTFYFTNLPNSPVGSPATLATNIVRTTNVATRFIHTFANVFTNQFFTSGLVTTRDTFVGPPPLSPVGTPSRTNVTVTSRLQNFTAGSFFIAPSNQCGFQIISTQLVTTVLVTNSLSVATNAPTTTNVNNQSFTREIITYFTNFTFVAFPVICGTNNIALRPGIDKITFVRRNFDSLLGQFFEPVTNEFQLLVITNNRVLTQTFRRIITAPDIVFAADDLVAPPAINIGSRNINFNSTNAPPTLAGPGTIEPPVRITFQKVGPIFRNSNPFFIEERTANLFFIWGSFDGSTNPPVVYPSGTSIMNLENQVLNPSPP